MKAIIYTEYGPPEVLRLAEVAKPTPEDNEVLIKVRATTVSVADSRVRSFTVPPSFWLPARIALGLRKPKRPILGSELAGEVQAVGKGVTRFEKGDEVFGTTPPHFGAYAEYTCLPATGPIAIKPPKLSYEEAAAVTGGGRTALHYLKKADVQRGQSILIYGASGSVGTYAIQLAKIFGAEVTGVCSTANLDLVTSLGADQVIDYSREDFTKNGETHNVIFVAVNECSFSVCVGSLKKEGVYINVTEPFPSARMLWISATSDKRVILGQKQPDDAKDLNFLRELIEAGSIKPVIDKYYPLEQVVEAHRYVDKGHKKGNVAITVGHHDDP